MFGSILGPKVSLNLIRVEISKQLKKKVDQFSIFYEEGGKLFFIIDEKFHPFEDNGKISDVLKTQFQKHLEDIDQLDAFLISYDATKETKSIEAKIMFVKDSQKQMITEYI